MKEKLYSLFGTFGTALWFLISAIYCYSPLLIFKFPFYVELLLFLAMFTIPFVGEFVRVGLYIWAFTIAIKMPIDALTIIFYVCAFLYFFTELLPFIFGILGLAHKRNNQDDDEVEIDRSPSSSQNPMREKVAVLEDEIAELDDIYNQIKRKGLRSAEVVDMASEAGMAPDEYKLFIKHKLVDKQRYYNTIIEQEGISRTPYIIDTYDENYANYKMLDTVEIDIEKRIEQSSRFFETKEIGRNEKYIVYLHDHTFLRKTKGTNSIVYLGKGGSISALFGNWVYWVESKGMLGNSYIMRRSIDGEKTEKFDWLSNKKMWLAGPADSVHRVSEDMVTSMTVGNDVLIIRVKRRSLEDAFYQIIVKDKKGVFSVNSVIESGQISELKDCSIEPIYD